jgi:hypothetical protein
VQASGGGGGGGRRTRLTMSISTPASPAELLGSPVDGAVHAPSARATASAWEDRSRGSKITLWTSLVKTALQTAKRVSMLHIQSEKSSQSGLKIMQK